MLDRPLPAIPATAASQVVVYKPKRTLVQHPRIAITKRTLDALAKTKPDKDAVHWDRAIKRFGVRHAPSGCLSFLIQFRTRQGKSRRLTLGDYGTWTAAEANAEAKRLLRIVDEGGDPVRERQEERRAITFSQLVDEYMDKAGRGLLEKSKQKKPGTIAIDRYRVRHLVRHFGDQPVRDITRLDCKRCLERLIAGKHGAARTFGLLGGILTYAVDEQHITTNPAHGIKKPADGKRRVRLDNVTYRALGKALETAKGRAETWQAVAAISLLAITGCRLNEILRLNWTEVDPQERCLRLGDSKTGASIRPVGEPALQLLETIRKRPGRLLGDLDIFVLPGVRNRQLPFSGLGHSGGGAWARIVGIGCGYSAHGLRHGFASVAGNLGYSELTIGALLGHRRAGATAGYVHLDKVLNAAADAVAGHIWRAMTVNEVA